MTLVEAGPPSADKPRWIGLLRRLLGWQPARDGRIVLLAVIVAYLVSIAAGRLMWDVDLWPALGVPVGPSLFFDARNLTAAWECDRLGHDPLFENPCDPHGRPLMYLRPWLVLGVLGLDQSHTVLLATVLITGMFLSFGLLVGRVPLGTGIVLALAACSPAVMLAVERANMDVALFSVVAAAVLLWRIRPGAAAVVSPLLVLSAASAKIYPVFALPAFLATRSRIAARSAVLCVLAFVVYLASSFRDVVHAAQIAIQGEQFSYGARILLAHLYHQLLADRWAVPAAVKQVVALGVMGLVATVVVWWLSRRAPIRRVPVASTATLLGFYAGALIYLGTFAVANNFDYRLVFLLLTLPQLVEWTRGSTAGLPSLAGATLLAVVLLLWVGSLSGPLRLWDELASWLVASLFTGILLATAPSWSDVRTMFTRAAERPAARA